MSIPVVVPKYLDVSSPTLPAGSRSSNLLTREQYVQYKINEGSSPQQAENAAKFLYDGLGEVFNTETGRGQRTESSPPPAESRKIGLGDSVTIPQNSETGTGNTTFPTGLSNSPPLGFVYTQVMPPEGYKYGYSADGLRYTVPLDYQFADGEAGNETLKQPIFTPNEENTSVIITAPEPGIQQAQQPESNIEFDPAIGAGQTGDTGSTGGTDTTTDYSGNPYQGRESNMANSDFDVSDRPAYSTDVSGGQQIISGSPQSLDEVNVVDYYGTMADRPVLQPETQLAPQIEKQVIGTDEIQGYTDLGAVAPSVSATQPGVTQVVSPTIAPTELGQTTLAGIVDRPAVTKVEALKSYEQVNEAADAFQAAQLDLSEIDPRATVQGQLALLQDHFSDGQTPIWAQGALKQASALMAQRGMGSSTMAAEAITNALMQSALPIAQQDSSFYQSVTMQNLVNEQEAEITKFNARLSSIFNDQAAENTARNINAQNENDTARFFAELSQNVVMANTAAVNAMEQFNTNAKNQANQFAAEIGLQADTINAQMANDMAQFNADQLLTAAKFNATMKDAREKFNVTNQIAIDANNISWRRQVNTANTAALNAAIQTDVQNLLGLKQNALNNIWNHYDTMLNMAFQREESAKDRATNAALATLDAEARAKLAEEKATSDLLGDIFEGVTTIIADDTAWDTISGWLPW